MDLEEWQRRGQSFDSDGDAYDIARPGYPREAAAWVAGASRGTVLELGSGTGKATRELADLGHDVIATDLSGSMLTTLRRHVPGVHTMVARAEDIPLEESTIDIVVAAQAYHWFDTDRALPEIARVLRPGGLIGLIWNQPDRTIPWVRRLFDLIDSTYGPPADDPLGSSAYFGPSEVTEFRQWQVHSSKASLRAFAESCSAMRTLEDDERVDVLTRVDALYDDYGRGRGGLRLPWTTACYRSRVRPDVKSHPVRSVDDGLLIDFDW